MDTQLVNIYMKIKNKITIKALSIITMTICLIMVVTSCSDIKSLNELTPDKAYNIIVNDLSCDSNDCIVEKNDDFSEVDLYSKGAYLVILFDNTPNAIEDIKSNYDAMCTLIQEDKDNGCLEGELKISSSDNHGYLLIYGEGVKDGQSIEADSDYYFGLYYSDNVTFKIYADPQVATSPDEVDRICKAFGLPTPAQ